MLAVPLCLVNFAAVYGQLGYFRTALHMGTAVALGVSLAIESTGIFLAAQAHAALLSDQSSSMLRLSSYGVAGLAAILNWWHFSQQSPAAGYTFALLSASSPWLWGVWSRSRNRDRLAQLGLVDERGVKLSLNRKLWWPGRSLGVLRHAAWVGETDPRAAVASWEAERIVTRASRRPVPAVRATATAITATGRDGSEQLAEIEPPADRLADERDGVVIDALDQAGTIAIRARVAAKLWPELNGSPAAIAVKLSEYGYHHNSEAIRSALRRGPDTGPIPVLAVAPQSEDGKPTGVDRSGVPESPAERTGYPISRIHDVRKSPPVASAIPPETPAERTGALRWS